MEKTRSNKILDKAYNSYIRYRQVWIDKGYGMDKPLSREAFDKYYNNARDRGDKNVTRKFAQMDRTWTKAESKKISEAFMPKEGDSEKVLKIKAKYAGKNPWQMEGRKAIFEDLQEVFGSYQKAEEYIYS